MKKKTVKPDESKVTGFFGRDTELRGELSFNGIFRIDGRFQGKIDSDAVLLIGENGRVEADIKVSAAVINGEVKGDIHASEKVEINAKGRVFGSITTPRLTIEEGAHLEATCQTTEGAPMPERRSLQAEDEKNDT
jgi:cytoskeletal protein CcmA (bactofilin family)